MKELEDEIAEYQDWQGYIWMIEDQEPHIYHEIAVANIEVLYINNNKKNLFNGIQEALLYSASANKSIIVKNIDGKEMLFVHRHAEFKSGDFKTDDNFIKVPGFAEKSIKTLKYKQVYKKQVSVSGASMKYYQPIFKLFVGLEK